MDRLMSEKEILKNAFYIKRKGCGLIDVVEVDAIKAIPSAEPKTGHWIDTDEGFSPCECSECKSVEFKKSKFCPNCGVKMIEPQESEE